MNLAHQSCLVVVSRWRAGVPSFVFVLTLLFLHARALAKAQDTRSHFDTPLFPTVHSSLSSSLATEWRFIFLF
jgi:hypothetical protein